MNHSYLVIHGSPTQRKEKVVQLICQLLEKQKIKFPNPDILSLEGKTSVSINQIRKLKNQIQRKPYLLPKKFAVIWEAEKLTLPAQNSLLKLLEEPPQNTIIILAAQDETLLLPTVVSRCQIIKLSPQEKKERERLSSQSLVLLKKIFQGGLGERFQEAEALSKDKEETIKFLNEAILLLRQILLKQLAIKKPTLSVNLSLKNLSPSQLLTQIKAFQKTKGLIKKNINPRLALENLFLKIPKIEQQLKRKKP